MSRELFAVWNLWTHGKRLSKENRIHVEHTKNDGLARTTKAMASPAWKARTNKTKARVKARTNTKERANTTARKRRQDATKWRGTTKHKTHKPVKITQDGRTQVEITVTAGMTQTGGQRSGARICVTWCGNKRHDGWCCRDLLKNNLSQCTGAAFHC